MRQNYMTTKLQNLRIYVCLKTRKIWKNSIWHCTNVEYLRAELNLVYTCQTTRSKRWWNSSMFGFKSNLIDKYANNNFVVVLLIFGYCISSSYSVQINCLYFFAYSKACLERKNNVPFLNLYVICSVLAASIYPLLWGVSIL